MAILEREVEENIAEVLIFLIFHIILILDIWKHSLSTKFNYIHHVSTTLEFEVEEVLILDFAPSSFIDPSFI